MKYCNYHDVTSVYSLNSRKLPGRFSYGLGTRLCACVLYFLYNTLITTVSSLPSSPFPTPSLLHCCRRIGDCPFQDRSVQHSVWDCENTHCNPSCTYVTGSEKRGHFAQNTNCCHFSNCHHAKAFTALGFPLALHTLGLLLHRSNVKSYSVPSVSSGELPKLGIKRAISNHGCS